jgi:hypothetical protein
MVLLNHQIVSLRLSKKVSVAVVLIATGCLDPYPPPLPKGEVNFLAVDGFLNSSNGLARVKLSRALPLESTSPFPPVQSASVRIARLGGTSFDLTEVAPGLYQTNRPDLQVGSSYRLELITPDRVEYQSDYVVLKQSPVLEDVSWTADEGGITIHVDSRDPTGNTRYYQWLYNETWEYDADVFSAFVVKFGTVVPRGLNDFVHVCYSSAESFRVMIGSTRHLTGDFINDYPLLYIPKASKKLSRTYSILVQQRALDETSYSYWLQLQQTSENLGGLFDPLPAESRGNIHSTTNPDKIALGYFTGGGVEEKRIFIRHGDLPDNLKVVKRRFCVNDTIPPFRIRDLADGTPLITPLGVPIPVGYVTTAKNCLDCRTEGGTLTKPSFWPN